MDKKNSTLLAVALGILIFMLWPLLKWLILILLIGLAVFYLKNKKNIKVYKADSNSFYEKTDNRIKEDAIDVEVKTKAYDQSSR